jgi:sulfoxide reductase catalytic subunit YedY
VARAFDSKIFSRGVTAESVFFDRRRFLSALGVGIAAGPSLFASPAKEPELLAVPYENDDVFPATRNAKYGVPEDIRPKGLTSREAAASHNNFYEFLPGQGGPVWEHTADYEVEPWKVEIGGECDKPTTLDLDDLLAFEQEERIYHFRCVERWAMNVPWTGFPLSKLLARVEPTAAAKYVRFETALKKNQMPGVVSADYYPWPYREGLRMDEAMNELAFVVTGVYGKPLLRQHGAPVRIAVPWKYGYKNPKAIAKIELMSKEPKTFWQILPHEYGFISNVNPFIPHPRWSQGTSYWLEDSEPFPTPVYNGYESYVGALYPSEPRTLQKPLTGGQKAR